MTDDDIFNPHLNRLAKDATQSKAYRKSRQHEASLAKRSRGEVTLGSGNKRVKGDVRKRGVHRLEDKLTGAESFRVTRGMLDKIEHAALANNELAALIVGFIDKQGNVTEEYAVIKLHDLLMLMSTE